VRAGAPVHLQPQPARVLALLAAAPGRLVTREELRQHVWGSGTFVDFDQGLNWCIRRIREALEDDAAAPRYIQTVPRRGYRFIAPAPGRQRRWWSVAAGGCAVAVCAGLLLAASPRNPVTVVVLPFEALSDPRDADVATQELITGLGKLDPRRLAVIDPLTAAKFKRTGECIISIGTQLGAQYVLLGATRHSEDGLRVTAQLFRVADNRQVWAAAELSEAGADVASLYARMAWNVAVRLGVAAHR
jgi:TolB-like protein